MATRRARHPRSCLPGRARRRRNWAPRASSAAAPEEGAAGSKLERLPRAAGPARAGCAVSRCAGRLARAPRGPSTSSLSASLTLTAPSEHPGCWARPAPGPRPPRPTPRAPPAGGPSTRALARVSQRRGGAGPRARGRQSTWGGQSVYLRVLRRTHLSCC